MHHSCAKGKKVRVKLKSGEVYVDRFKEKNDRYCITDSRRVPWSKVRNFVVYRHDR